MSQGKEMSLDERVGRYIEAQQLIADELGLAVPTPHGEPISLYDIWGGQLLNIIPSEVTRVKMANGNITITREQTGAPEMGS